MFSVTSVTDAGINLHAFNGKNRPVRSEGGCRVTAFNNFVKIIKLYTYKSLNTFYIWLAPKFEKNSEGLGKQQRNQLVNF